MLSAIIFLLSLFKKEKVRSSSFFSSLTSLECTFFFFFWSSRDYLCCIHTFCCNLSLLLCLWRRYVFSFCCL